MRERNTESLEYQSNERNDKEQQHYTPRPKFHVIMAWVLLIVVIVAVLGTCYWQIFGIF